MFQFGHFEQIKSKRAGYKQASTGETRKKGKEKKTKREGRGSSGAAATLLS